MRDLLDPESPKTKMEQIMQVVKQWAGARELARDEAVRSDRNPVDFAIRSFALRWSHSS